MDVSGSFLELSCARVALVPVDSSISETRFEELVSHLNSCREVPLNALPRRAALPRPTGSATLSSMPDAFREALQANNSPVLARSRSAGRDFTRTARRAAKSSPNLKISNNSKDTSGESSEDMTELPKMISTDSRPNASKSGTDQIAGVAEDATYSEPSAASQSNSVTKFPRQDERSLRQSGCDLDLSSSDVDSSFRMRFEVVRRDGRGALLFKSPSEWDEFHSSRTWGVIGICDDSNNDTRGKDARLKNAYSDFSNLLEHFKKVPIRRLMVLSSADTSRASPPVFFQEPTISTADGSSQAPFSVGFIPGNLSYNETKLEIRAQVTHFAGLLIAAIDRDCWKRRESPQSELFLSPIDERHSADRQSKLAKRRAGRLDKLLADSLLLMGSPREALVKYNSAIERAKASSDRLWLAGAMEGWSAAHVLSHIGSGGQVDDVDLTDMLVEHYNEIYKLYQKKRAIEPEAGAALRLAEYLGTWTSRRKDALNAAQHAATVGEGLKLQKRASLWEALARFSESMGCRRKAALFLYRLGRFNASQSSWSSAVELMLASEGQLSRRGARPWTALNRQILLLAAKYAEEANDSNTAARLLVEALVVSPSPKGTTETDEYIMAALQRAQVPSFIPGSSKIIDVDYVDPLNLQGSSFKMKLAEEVSELPESGVKSGPFIYNPFEAKKKAKAAAVARQTVTWVSGEPAHVSLTLRNRIGTKIRFELISVLFAQEDETDAFWPFGSNVDSLSDEQILISSKKHGTKVREALETSSSLVKTISESVQVDPAVPVSKSVTVIPKRRCHITVKGLLIRLFGGALVIITSPSTSDEGRSVVNVMPELPILSVTYPSSGVASTDTFGGRRTPISVLDGETREVKVSIRNTGKDRISWVSAKMEASDRNCISTHAEGLRDADLLQALQLPGSTHTVILTLRRGLQTNKGMEEQFAASHCREHKGSCVVTLIVQYEGCSAPGIVRESHASMKIVFEPVIRVDRVRRIGYGMASSPIQDSGSLVAVELSNLGSVPADVNLSQLKDEELGSHNTSHPEANLNSSAHRRCLLESGASVRLVQSGALRTPSRGEEGEPKHGFHGHCSESVVSKYRVDWTLPAFGRKGFRDVYPSKSVDGASSNPRLLYDELEDIRPQIYLFPRDLHGHEIAVQPIETSSVYCVQVGVFVTIVVRLKLDSSVWDKPTELNATIESGVSTSIHGQHCVSLAGACRHVPVHLLKRTGEFLEHQFRVRVLSVGAFCVRVALQAKDTSSNGLPDESKDAPALSGSNECDEPASSKQGVLEENVLAGSQRTRPQQTKTRLSWAASSMEEMGDYSGSELRRLNLNPSMHVIRPTTVDRYQSDNQSSESDLLATSFLTLKAVSHVK